MNMMSGFTVAQRKQRAVALLQAGQIAEAKEVFEGLSKDARRDPDVWHLLAACHSMLGDYVQCETFARKAIALLPSFSGAWSNLGSALHSQGKLAEAANALREAIKLSPTDALAHNNLGGVYRDLGETDDAERSYREALRLQPNFPDALTNLGLVLQDRHELAAAIDLHKHALSLNPQHVDALYNLGYTLMVLGQANSALPYLEQMAHMRPNDVRGWITLGSAYARMNDSKRAAFCYERAVALDPNNVENLKSLGICYLSIGEREKSIAVLEHALELSPQDNDARYWLAAAGIGEVPEKMAPGAVAKLFDIYAGNFDAHLVGNLQYRTPTLLGDALRRARNGDTRSLDILDLGCGTGLLGVEVKDIAGHLEGVDISPKMIEQARKRGIYHDLSVRDITEFMAGSQRRYDALMSADVFIYFGNLDRVFSGAGTCLADNGFFVFSVEMHTGDEPFHLRSSGRYGHSISYLRELAVRHNFREISVETVTLRLDNGAPVKGYVMVLRRLTRSVDS